MSLPVYDYGNATGAAIMRRCAPSMFRRIENHKIVPTPEELARRFLDEVIAGVAGHEEPPAAHEALREYLASRDHSEGCPNAVVEAIASGRPDVGGIPELVQKGCGILVPPMNTDRLREALERALTTSWDEPGISEHFGRPWEDAAEETYEVCRRVVEERG